MKKKIIITKTGKLLHLLSGFFNCRNSLFPFICHLCSKNMFHLLLISALGRIPCGDTLSFNAKVDLVNF